VAGSLESRRIPFYGATIMTVTFFTGNQRVVDGTQNKGGVEGMYIPVEKQGSDSLTWMDVNQ
jgi:hypothetical protein